MENNELNLCNCGYKPELRDHRLSWAVNCLNCGACVIGDTAPEPDGRMSSEYWQRYKQTAIDKWNARIPIVLESEKNRTNGNCSRDQFADIRKVIKLAPYITAENAVKDLRFGDNGRKISHYLHEAEITSVVHTAIQAYLSAMPTQDGWNNDMSQAPRDGTPILLAEDKEVYIGYWIETEELEYTKWVAEDDSRIDVNPTHWMPLPAPPIKSNEE